MSTFQAIYTVSGGTRLVDNIYVRQEFAWNNTDDFNLWYSGYSAATTTFQIVAIGIFLPVFTQVLKLHDMTVVFIAGVCQLLGYVVILLAKDPDLLYLYGLCFMFTDINTVGVRAALTKIVGNDEVGKTFACVGALGAILGLVNPLYNKVYTFTYEWHPGFVYCIGSIIIMVQIGCVVYIYVFLRMHSDRLNRELFHASPTAQSFRQINRELSVDSFITMEIRSEEVAAKKG